MATTPWDRSKQTYFILRRGLPWKVFSIDGSREVADYPPFLYDEALSREVCFAPDDDAVRRILKERP